jgi:xylulokinase
MALLIGIDIGTQGTKAAVYDENGMLVASAFEASELLRPSPEAVEEDADRQVASVYRTIAKCIGSGGVRPADVVGVAIDGQMAGVIGIGQDGRAVTPYDSWLDTRCAPQIERMGRTAEVEVTEKTGCAPSFNHGPKILWWKEQRPEVFSRIAVFVQPAGYAAMRLCNLGANDAFIDPSYLHFSGFGDTEGSCWDDGLCREFHLSSDQLPRIVKSHEVVGTIGEEGARESGLPTGIPVVAGCGDTAASFLSCAATEIGVCVDVAGTASVFAATTGTFHPDTQNRVLACSRSAVPGLWHPYAYINGGGMNLEWFRREFGGGDGLSVADLDTRALGVERPHGIPLFVPHLAGRVSPAMPNLRGSWVGLDWSHGQADLYRAVLEGVALEYGIYREVLLGLYPELDLVEIRVTGGGEVSELWNGIKASVLQMPVRKIEGAGGAAMGSAMLAGFGVGLFPDLNAVASRWVRVLPGALPNSGDAAHYRTRVRRYRHLLAMLNGFHNDEAGE